MRTSHTDHIRTKGETMQLLPDLSKTEPDEMEVAADATPLDFLRAVYRDPQQPMQRRMRAAEAALPFVHPKLSVAANVYSFTAQMEEASRRIGKSNVIDAK